MCLSEMRLRMAKRSYTKETKSPTEEVLKHASRSESLDKAPSQILARETSREDVAMGVGLVPVHCVAIRGGLASLLARGDVCASALTIRVRANLADEIRSALPTSRGWRWRWCWCRSWS